jgi:hypothetical protein
MAVDPSHNIDAEARAAVEGKSPGAAEPGGRTPGAPKPTDERPPAGTHADPALTNPLSTPGTGALTPPGGQDDIDSASG